MDKFVWIIRGTVVRIVDADTIVADLDLGFNVWLKNQFIRLYCINTPEVRGPEKVFGKPAKAFLEKILPVGTEICVSSHEWGKYGRIIGEVGFQSPEYDFYIDFLSDFLIENGYGKRWLPGEPKPTFDLNEEYPLKGPENWRNE